MGYVGHSALRALLDPAFGSQVLRPQEQSCVTREDVCRLVAVLRARQVKSFDLGADLTPEVTQRLAEYAYPLRAMRGAAVRVDLCNAAKREERILLSVKDVKRPSDGNADLCIVDRR